MQSSLAAVKHAVDAEGELRQTASDTTSAAIAAAARENSAARDRVRATLQMQVNTCLLRCPK
jgi:hypothetical protein